MHFEDLGDEAQGADDAVEFAVGDLDRDESDDVVSHLLQVDLPSRGLKDAGAEQTLKAALGGVPRDAQTVA